MKQFQNCSREDERIPSENLLERTTQKKGTQPLVSYWLRAGIVADCGNYFLESLSEASFAPAVWAAVVTDCTKDRAISGVGTLPVSTDRNATSLP